MQRRDVLKLAPLIFARVNGLAATGGAAEVKMHNGAPALFLDGQPVFAGLYWVSAPTPEKWESAAPSRRAAEAGIHIYAFDMGSGSEWIGPKSGRLDHFDFSSVEARYARVVDADPKARFHLRCQLEIGADDWWSKMYPDECELNSTGRRYTQSFASRVWRDQAKAFIRALVAHLEKTGLLDRVVAIQPGAGHTGEWVKGETAMYNVCSDYSEPMRRHFRAWLSERYGSDAARLRSAWNQSDASFDTAEVPSAAEQLQSKKFTFRDPKQEQKVIDYYRCLSELSGDLVVDFCRTVKEATGGKKLAGAFYGYLLEAWNGGFFGERPDSDYSTTQRGGHLGLRRVLASPDVDFLVSPYSYGFRGMGGDGPSMLPAASVRLHGKLCLVEDDTRTHIDSDKLYGHANTLAESVAILRRNFAQVAVRGQGMWWASWKVDPVAEPAFFPVLKNFEKVGAFSLRTDRSPSAESAVILDDESFLYESNTNYLDVPLIFQQRLWGLTRTGAAFDTYLLQDLVDGRMKPYKVYIFLNAFRLDAARRAALKRELQRDGRVAVWIYAPGYIEDDLSLDNMRDLTGFQFAIGDQPWGVLINLLDFTHPITAGLPQDLSWGTTSKLWPIFYVQDPDARVLGQAVFSQGQCQPGFAVKKFANWTSIYSAAPNLPAPVLRGIARFAGAHLYSEAGDVLHASRDLLAVHTVAGGPRVFKLPRTAEIVQDLFENRAVARHADTFQVTLAPKSTTLYYTGASGLLAALKENS
jgi:hypothetical protein